MKGFGPKWPGTRAKSFGKCAMEPEWHFVRESPSWDGKNGQPKGYAVTSTTRKPWVAGTDRKTCNATGQNNSNPTPYAASAVNGEWELLARIVPIIVL